jgi:hypothetical protein
MDLAKSDDDPILLGWKDTLSQTSRFDVFMNECVESGDRVMDFGCGLSRLYGYLKENGIDVNYTGIDIMPHFIKKSKEIYGDSIKVVNTNALYYLEEFEWVFASGVFSIGFTLDSIVEHIKHFTTLSKKGVCFNLLNKETFEGDVQVSFIKDDVVKLLKENIKDFDVIVIDNYSIEDFTIILKTKSH